MTTTTISVSRDPHEPHWQLGPLPPPAGQLVLLAWQQSPVSNEAGVPKSVADVLCSALSSVARVTFLSSERRSAKTGEWESLDGDFVCTREPGLVSRLGGLLKKQPANASLVSTRRPETLTAAFGDPGCPWWLQGQVMLLSDPLAGPPDVEADDLLALLDDEWATGVAALASKGVRGAVRPGVDGDVAGVLMLSAKNADALLVTLEREAQRAGVVWTVS